MNKQVKAEKHLTQLIKGAVFSKLDLNKFKDIEVAFDEAFLIAKRELMEECTAGLARNIMAHAFDAVGYDYLLHECKKQYNKYA